MSIRSGAYDPSARYAGTSPSKTMERKAQLTYLPCHR